MAGPLDKFLSFFRRPEPTPEPSRSPVVVKSDLGKEPWDPFAAQSQGGIVEWYYQWLTSPADRAAEMKFYDRIEKEVVEVEKGLNAYATMATTGTLSGLNRGTFSIRVPDEAPPELKDRMTRVQGLMRQHAFTLARGMCQYGSYPAWLKVGDLGIDGKIGVIDIQHLPPGTMFRNLKSTDPNQLDYWAQTVNGKVEATLSRWQTPHFALWVKPVNAMTAEVYGRSALKPCGRIGLQCNATQDSVVIGRLTRANQKIVIKIDCSDLRNDPERDKKIMARMEKWKQAYSRRRTLLPGGSMDSYEQPPIPDERFYMPGGTGLEGFNVEALAADSNITNIDDVKYLKECFAGAIGVPLEYLGHSGSRGGRSVLSQVDINFARSARYIQLYLAAGFLHVVNVETIAAGFDPRKYPCEVVPPTIGARDDLLQAQVRMLQSQVMKNLVDAGFDATVDPKWVMMNLLNMDDEITNLDDTVIKRLFKDPPAAAPPNGAKQTTGSKASAEAMLAIAAKGVDGYIDSIRSILEFTQATMDEPMIPADYDQPSSESLLSVMEAIKKVKGSLAA